MVEVQKHGFTFEKWVRDTLFRGYEGNYMQKWDVPPDHNKHPAMDSLHRALPVSIKTAGFGSPIGLGDALRQRSTDQPFVMIAGFWTQRTATEKWFEAIGAAKFRAKEWSALWGSLTLDNIAELDAMVKDMSKSHTIARKRAQEWKKRFFADSGSCIVLNPKIDSKAQRRVQCSLPFSVFWEFAGAEPERVDAPELYGIPFENPIVSSARTFKKKKARD
jgi:hypothetical protein